MVFISDVFITIPLEIIFFYLFYLNTKYYNTGKFVQILNYSFLLVNLLVAFTVIISDIHMNLSTQGWLLGFFTNLSYLILPWFFYWFVSNYKFLTKTKDLTISNYQITFLLLVLFFGLIPLLLPNLITLTHTSQYDYWNWDYAWQILAGQAMLWMLFMIFYVIVLSRTSMTNLPEPENKFIRYINFSAIIVFSTPVFFVIASEFILLSLVVYVIAYYFMYDALKTFSTV